MITWHCKYDYQVDRADKRWKKQPRKYEEEKEGLLGVDKDKDTDKRGGDH